MVCLKTTEIDILRLCFELETKYLPLHSSCSISTLLSRNQTFLPFKIATSLVKTCSHKTFKMATSLLNPASILFLSLTPHPPPPIHLLQRMLFDYSELLLLAQRCTCPPFTQRYSALLTDYSALLRATLELLSVALMCILFTQCCSELLIMVIQHCLEPLRVALSKAQKGLTDHTVWL